MNKDDTIKTYRLMSKISKDDLDKTIMIDLDEILFTGLEGRINVETKNWLNFLHSLGYHITLVTNKTEKEKKLILYILERNNINYDTIYFNFKCGYFISSRAIKFDNNWKDILENINKNRNNYTF